MSDPWLRIADVAALALVHPATVRRAIRSRFLQAVRVNGGRALRIRESWAHQWLQSVPAAQQSGR